MQFYIHTYLFFIQDLYEYCNRPRRSILEVLEDFQVFSRHHSAFGLLWFESHPSFFWTCSSTKKVYIEKGRKRLHLFKAFIILFKTASTSFSSWTPFPTSRWITFSICFRSLKRAPFPLPALSLQFQTEFRLGNILFGWLFCLYMLLKRCVISKLLSARNYL